VTVPAGLSAARALLEELAVECPGTAAAAKVPAALAGLAELEDIARTSHETEVRLHAVADTLFGLASLDFSRRAVIRGDGSVLDGVVGCINMLGEELQSFLEDRERIEHELERRVEQRTQERERVEGELRIAQKLEAVGRLASGVAHEINTPVQFINDSVQFVRVALTDMTVVIAKLRAANRAVLAGAPSQEAAVEALEAEDDAELEYVLDQGPKALDRAIDGLDQVASIVRSMKAFAHPDAEEMLPVDLNRAIESTLVMARNEYKYVADAATDFGEIPLVTCYAGEINQAVLNILVNAGHAIADVVGTSGVRGRITVTTRRDGAHVIIAIADTGTGIPEDIRSRIFDPFFTTKEVGRGTGQGLAMVHSIVEKHAGSLNVHSVVGQGTTFEIRLPIEGKRRGAVATSRAA
jgi:signal transduction histidine kinase